MSQIDMFVLFDAPTPAAPEVPRGPDLQAELLTIAHRDGGLNIFQLQDRHFEHTGRCHHFCELYDAMEQLDRDGWVTCDFATGERIWYLSK